MSVIDFNQLIRNLLIRNYDQYEKEQEKAILPIISPTTKMTTLRIFDKTFVFDNIAAQITQMFCIQNKLHYFIDAIHNRLEINFIAKEVR